MRFKGLDLNHLVVLDHLLSERSVSRAADKLSRTQSTISGILAELRLRFGDDLLVQVGREMVPTARGRELAGVVRDLLMQVEATVLTPPEFNPTLTDRRIRLFASDYLMIAGLAEALRQISLDAPNLQIEVLQPTQFQRGREGPAALLENGSIDLLALPQMFLSANHPSLPLFTETCCCIVCRDNPNVGDEVEIEHFLQLGHVTVNFGPDAFPSYEEWFNKQFGREARRIEVTAGSFATMPFLLPGTRRIALSLRRLAEAFTRILPLRIVEPRFGIPPLVEALQWHHYASADPAVMWVRDRIVATMALSQPDRIV